MIRIARSPQGLLLVLLVSLFASDLSLGATAVKKVAAGIRHFQAGRFDEADRAFVEAEVSAPENATIWFDRACALVKAHRHSSSGLELQRSRIADVHRLQASEPRGDLRHGLQLQ